MKTIRRVSLATLGIACMQLVFGAIVRISGSGMGCGDHWPKCNGAWFPPLNRPDLVVELSHRYLATILGLAAAALLFAAWRRRREPGVGGPGGTLRPAAGAFAAVLTAAILGSVTVRLGNATYATVAHWLVAMTVLALVATTAIRAGALGGDSASTQHGSAKTARGARVAAGLAILVVAMGGLTAKFPGAAAACTSFPACGSVPNAVPGAAHVQLTHRVLALLLTLHLIGLVAALGKRKATEAPVVVRAARIALALLVLQIIVAASMVLMHLPPELRSLHEAVGVGIWLACFSCAYLASMAESRGRKVEEGAKAPRRPLDSVASPLAPRPSSLPS